MCQSPQLQAVSQSVMIIFIHHKYGSAAKKDDYVGSVKCIALKTTEKAKQALH